MEEAAQSILRTKKTKESAIDNGHTGFGDVTQEEMKEWPFVLPPPPKLPHSDSDICNVEEVEEVKDYTEGEMISMDEIEWSNDVEEEFVCDMHGIGTPDAVDWHVVEEEMAKTEQTGPFFCSSLSSSRAFSPGTWISAELLMHFSEGFMIELT